MTQRLALVVLLSCAPLLAGCPASIPTVDVPRETRVEIPVPCIAPEDRPAKPALRAAEDLDAMDDYDYTLATRSELEKLWGYTPRLEALIESCSRLTGSGPPGP